MRQPMPRYERGVVDTMLAPDPYSGFLFKYLSRASSAWCYGLHCHPEAPELPEAPSRTTSMPTVRTEDTAVVTTPSRAEKAPASMANS